MPRKTSIKYKKRDIAEKGKKGGVAMQQQNQEGVNPLLGAAVGAAVGGVVGAAAAVALSDKDTREKVKKVASNLKDQAADRMQEMTTKAKDVATSAKDVAQKQLNEPTKKEETK